MDPRRREVLVIAGCVVVAALAVVGTVLLAGVKLPPGLGLLPLGAFVAVLFLVRRLMAVAHHRATLLSARKKAAEN
jgi:NADH:ubiquinone oxidoreductase subunit 6 (subunit J)